MDKYRVERRCLHLLAAGENHTGYPEEDNVIAGDQNISGIEVLQFFRLFRPTQGRERPQRGAEPSIQNVRVALNILGMAALALRCIGTGNGHVAAVLAVPCGNLMTPPQLTGNAPILHVVHPVQIGLGEPVGHKLHFAVFHHANGLFCQRLHLHEPLVRCQRLHVIVAAVAGTHVVCVILHLDQIALLLQIGHNGFPCLVTVHAVVLAAVDDVCVAVENQNLLQIVAQTHFEVVGVVAGRHLDGAGAESQLHVLVGHNGNFPADQRQNCGFAHKFCKAFIFGVHGNAAVAQHGFGTGGCHDDVLVRTLDGVTDMPQMAGFLHVLHLGIAQCGGAVGAPVDDALALINQALFVQVAEHFPHGLCAGIVHGKPQTVPVAGAAQCFQLFNDAVAEFVLPSPDFVQELFTTQIEPGQTLVPQLFFHLNLGCNARMVIAGHPQCLIALHSLVTNQNILNRFVERMTQMELTRHVGGRNHNGKGFFIRIGLGMEIAALDPHIIDRFLDLLGFIDFWQFFHEFSSFVQIAKAP